MNDGKELERGHSSYSAELERFRDRLKQVLGEEAARSFADRAGLSETALRKYLNGESTPNLERLLGIAHAAGVSVAWLAVGDVRAGVTPIKAAQDGAGAYKTGETDDAPSLAASFERGVDLAFELSENDPNPNPPAIWSPLVIELATLHGLNASGVDRLYEVLRRLQARNRGE